MRAIIANSFFVVAIAFALEASGQVPHRFVGTWIVNAASTSATIAADPNMTPENKPGWTRRWLESGAEFEVSETSITFRSPETGVMTFSVTSAEDLGDHIAISASIQDPSLKDEMNLAFELRLSRLGELNFRILEENDFDLIIWQRRDAVPGNEMPGESVAEGQGTILDYLDSLGACKQGDFHLSYPGFGTVHNTILGKDGDRCKVRSEIRQVKMTCNFSAETIALLTSEAKYQEARTGILSGSTSSEESKRMESECRVD